ncbi:MAG TPA: class I SAM-dependent methyltransferase [Polyangiaceae bacterium]|nr:class I SAM-dependent methyltransferase [Polyangiaceae bacterium]
MLALDEDAQSCAPCGVVYRREDGIWRMLGEGRQQAFREFVTQYETVRTAEARRVQDPEHLRALPFRDRSRRRSYEWRIRARSYRALLTRVVGPLEAASHGPRKILDMGSGVGWLAYRLALRGHDVAAIDLVTNDFDGMGLHKHYDRAFTSLQAEFDRLPFQDGSVDLVINNASFHYAADYAATLREALRVLAPDGRIVIMDTPIYRDGTSGQRMVQERENAFERRYGFRGTWTEGFLTDDRLAALAVELGLHWEIFEPWYGVRWWIKPWIARVRGGREPARFKLVVGRRRRKASGAL